MMTSRMIMRGVRRAATAAVCAVALAPPAAAQFTTPPARPGADTAAVVVLNRHVVTFRSAFLGRHPQVRAAGAATRIVAASRREGPGLVTVATVPQGRALRADGRTLFILTPDDVDVEADATLDETAGDVAMAIEDTLAELRNQRSLGHLARAAGVVLLVTGLLAVLMRLLLRAGRGLHARLERFVARGARTASVAGFQLFEPRRLRRLVARALMGLALLLGSVVGYLWLTFVLRQFPFSRPWGDALGAFLLERVGFVGRGIASAVPGLLTVVIIFVVARWFARVVNGFFLNVEQGRTLVRWVHPETAQPTRRIMVALVWLFALVAAYPFLPGSDSGAFKGLSVLVGLMISLGSGSLIGQALSGLALMYSRALRPGDWVRIDEMEGSVLTLSLFSTKLCNAKHEEITIPNAVVLATKTINFTRLAEADGTMAYTTVTIGYDAPWRQVEAMLLEAAGRTEGLRAEPAPFVLQTALSDFYPEYQLNARLERVEEKLLVMSRLHGHIQDVFNEHGVQIMSPHYRADPDQPLVVPKDQWFAPPARPAEGA